MLVIPLYDETCREILGFDDKQPGPALLPTDECPSDESEDEGVFADDLAYKPLWHEPDGDGPEDAISFLEAINGRLRHEFSLDDYLPFPDEVIFHNPATIIYWDDGEKTVLKCHGDDAFDERMDLMVATVKKVSAKLKVDEHEELLKALSKLTATEMHVVADALTVVASVVDAMENPEE
jgi:hypothetical protein